MTDMFKVFLDKPIPELLLTAKEELLEDISLFVESVLFY